MDHAKNTELSSIKRRAIDPSGQVDSLYDIRRDCVLRSDKLTDSNKYPTLQSQNCVECRLVYNPLEKSENLMKMIDIDGDLRLNILLDPKLRNGIAELVDHTGSTDDSTRLLYISYTDHEKRMPNNLIQERVFMQSLTPQQEATHIIIAVTFGIDLAMVLKLTNDKNKTEKVDYVLKNMQCQLNKSNDFSSFRTIDDNILQEIREINVYSNLVELSNMKSLREIFQYITARKSRPDSAYGPLMFTLQPIKCSPSDMGKPDNLYIPLMEYERDKLEQYLIEVINQMKNVNYFWGLYVSNQFDKDLKKPLEKMKEQWETLKQNYNGVLRNIKKSVVRIQQGRDVVFEINEVLNNSSLINIKEDVTQLERQINALKDKQQFINILKEKSIDYSDVSNYDINQNTPRQTLETKLITDDRQRLFCSNDRLKQTKRTKWNQLLDELEEQRKTDRTLKLIYADFSYCSFELEYMMILRSNKQKDDAINILLLGESGVGKSTFVNAFVNYLTFKTLEEAEKSKPVVLIPVSFLLTVGKNFDEQIVKFGDSDEFNNEDFDHPGQSVTQHCKSYLFTLNQMNGRKIRIIDTPGFGDTRGIDQDDLNMQHILEYIANLTHVNAICFLLKPNISEIHKFFKNCLTQIFDVLGPNVGANVVFCFTNCRTTFYSPGDTAPLLKKILNTFSEGNISFIKKNTFCFDNESFRYLVALQNQITFDNADKKEYENSWSKSVKESKNLLDYVRNEVKIYRKQNTHQSIKNAQFQITHMIRPMLEATRNILRNKILYDMKASNTSIELIANPLHGPATLCSICECDLIKKGKFWVAHAVPHEKLCQFCDCPPTRHIPIYYHIDYRYLTKPCNYSRKDMTDSINTLNNASVQFAFFLKSVARSSKDNPFLAGMTHMIEEEDDICRSRKSTNMNLKLSKELTVFMNKHLQRVENLESSQYVSDLLEIYECILTVSTHPLIQPQMEAIKKTQEEIMKLYEYQVPEKSN